MEYTKRKSVNDKLSEYMVGYNLSVSNDFIELTEWANGEGFDISIGDSRHFSLHRDEIEAIVHLRNCLDYKKFD